MPFVYFTVWIIYSCMCCWLSMSIYNDDHCCEVCMYPDVPPMCVCPGQGLWILPSLRAPLLARVCLWRHLHVFQLFNLKSIVLLESWDLFNVFVFPGLSRAVFVSLILLSVFFFLPQILLFSLFCLIMFSAFSPFSSFSPFVLTYIFCVSAENMLFDLAWKHHYNPQQRGGSPMRWSGYLGRGSNSAYKCVCLHVCMCVRITNTVSLESFNLVCKNIIHMSLYACPHPHQHTVYTVCLYRQN